MMITNPPVLHIHHSDDFEDIMERLMLLLAEHFSITLEEFDDPDAPLSCHTSYLLTREDDIPLEDDA